MTVAVLDRSFSSEYPASSKTEGRSLSWKRVFVQTDNGSVLGIELERGENAHSVKKKAADSFECFHRGELTDLW